MLIKYGWFVCVGLMLSVAGHAASFSCEKAKTQTEYAICEHRAVNDADVKNGNHLSYSQPFGRHGDAFTNS